MTSVLIRDKRWDTDTEDKPLEGLETGVRLPQGQGHGSPQKLEEAGGSLPGSFRREHGPPNTTWFVVLCSGHPGTVTQWHCHTPLHICLVESIRNQSTAHSAVDTFRNHLGGGPQAGQGTRAPGHRTFLSTFPSHQLASPEGSCSTSLELVACSVPLSNPRPPAHLGVE